ncbi:MAG: putative phage replication protein [Verrucomicrobiales bacterium]|nr:putative phage replication protein [Verrucomicrobiales bacterium]
MTTKTLHISFGNRVLSPCYPLGLEFIVQAHDGQVKTQRGQQKSLRDESLRPNWLRGWDLNPRPSGYEPDELPGCSTPRSGRPQYFPQRRFRQDLFEKINASLKSTGGQHPKTRGYFQRMRVLITCTAAGSSGNITGSSLVRSVRSPTRFTFTFTGQPQAL